MADSSHDQHTADPTPDADPPPEGFGLLLPATATEAWAFSHAPMKSTFLRDNRYCEMHNPEGGQGLLFRSADGRWIACRNVVGLGEEVVYLTLAGRLMVTQSPEHDHLTRWYAQECFPAEVAIIFRDQAPIRIDQAAEAQAMTQEASKPSAATEPGRGNKEGRALATLALHPDWNNKQIARAVGCHPKTLSNFTMFKAARAVQKAARRELARGRRDPETGNIEAWEADREGNAAG